MKSKVTTFARLLDAPTRRKLWDLRDQLRVRELSGVIRPQSKPKSMRFNRNGIRILEVSNHAYAR